MCRKIFRSGMFLLIMGILTACGAGVRQDVEAHDITENDAIFYDDINEQTIVRVIPLGHAEIGAETMADESGTVRLEFVNEEGEQIENG